MPDKGYRSHKCSDRRCLRCWRNKLKHANKLKKKTHPKKFKKKLEVVDEIDKTPNNQEKLKPSNII